MAEEQGRTHSGRGGFQRRENRWRDEGDRSWRGGRGGEKRQSSGYRSRDERGDREQRGSRGFDSRPDRKDNRYGRSEGNDRSRNFDRDRNFGGQRRDGGHSQRRESYGHSRSYDRRDQQESRGGYRSESNSRRGGYQDRGRFSRDGRNERNGRQDRFDGQRKRGNYRGEERSGGPQGRGGFSSGRSGHFTKEDREYRNYSSTAEYVAPNGDEPTIPAGVSAEELDAGALRALSTLTGPNKDIVARHLVMAGQLIDLDPEEAYKHAAAASSRAGRVDVVREAAALTAYASGRYEEALREVRAVRRMRGDFSLRAVEADCERGLGHPEKAIDIIDQTDTRALDVAEQVELVLVSSGARADMGQSDVGLVLVDDAIAALSTEADTELLRRLMSVKADRLRELGRFEDADEVEASMPDEIEDPDIVDVALFADADVDHQRSPLRRADKALAEIYDWALLDLDGTVWSGNKPINGANEAIEGARDLGMGVGFITNNAMRTAQMVADKLSSMGFEATPDTIMTSAMDVIALMQEYLEPGAKIFVIGGEGVRNALTEAGYELVSSAEEQPVAVVQGLDQNITWATLTEGAIAIQRGAQFFATNLDATLPTERGQALGNGSLVKAIQYATRKRPIAAGKPEPGIFHRASAFVQSQQPIAVGDRLETDIMGAVAAGIPAMHVLTGVHGAREVILAPRGQRPSYLALTLSGLLETHPRPKHHVDGTWTCGVSQVARVTREGEVSLDGIPLSDGMTISLDSYRALAVASWEAGDSGIEVRCPQLNVVDNDDVHGTVVAPAETHDEHADSAENQSASEVEHATVDAQEDSSTHANHREDTIDPVTTAVTRDESHAEESIGVHETLADASDTVAQALTFLPGEEELEELLALTSDEELNIDGDE